MLKNGESHCLFRISIPALLALFIFNDTAAYIFIVTQFHFCCVSTISELNPCQIKKRGKGSEEKIAGAYAEKNAWENKIVYPWLGGSCNETTSNKRFYLSKHENFSICRRSIARHFEVLAFLSDFFYTLAFQFCLIRRLGVAYRMHRGKFGEKKFGVLFAKLSFILDFKLFHFPFSAILFSKIVLQSRLNILIASFAR